MAYTGSVVRLPLGQRGFSGSRNPTQMQVDHLQYVEGMSLDGGLIQKDGGADKLNSAALGTPSIVRSGISWSPLASLNRDVVFLSSGNIRKDTGVGNFAASMEAGLNDASEPAPSFVVGGGESVGQPRKLFMFSSTNQVRVVLADGNSTAAISTPPADWSGAGNFPTFGVLHEGRIWGGGNASDPHRVYYSTPTNHQDYTGALSGSLSIFPGKGERLVGGVSFRGFLILFKYPRGIYTITTNDPAPTGWRVEELTDAVGSVNQQCIIQIDNDVLYMDNGGNFHLLSATSAFGGIQTSNISQIADISEFMRSEIDLTHIRRATGIWYATKQQAWFSLSGINQSQNNTRIMIDMSSPQTGVRFLVSRRDIPVSLWMRPDALGVMKPAHGDDVGFVWLMDRTTKNKDGVGYNLSFETANTDLGFADPKLATVTKNFDFLEVVFEPQGDWDLIVQVIVDDTPGPPLLYSMGSSGGAPLGSFILDTSILGSTSIGSIRKRIAGSGRRIRILVDNAGVDQNVAVSDFFLSFRGGDERNK